MPMTDQNFTIPSGDNAKPLVTLLDSAGAPLNVSSVQDILFFAVINDSIEVTKKLSNNTIAFVTDGTNGQVYLIFTALDFVKLTGSFPYQMYVVDSAGNVTEVITSSSVTCSPSYRGSVT